MGSSLSISVGAAAAVGLAFLLRGSSRCVQHFASTLTPQPPLQDAWQLCDSGPGRVGFHTAAGVPIVNTSRFPNLGAMVSHAHSLNLTSGWYGNNCICSDQSSAVSHFVGDVAAFRGYNFDSFKLDSCGAQKDIALYSNLLNNDGGKAVVVENCRAFVVEGVRTVLQRRHRAR